MLRVRRGLLCFIVLCASAAAAGAQDAKPEPAKALAAVPAGGFPLAGAMACVGAFRNGTPHKSSYTAAVILGGKWLELTEQDTEPATGYVAKYLIGYDAEQKRLVEYDANNFGAAVYTSADGWQNGVLTMRSADSTNPKAPFVANRFIYTMAAPDSLTIDWQVEKTAGSAWVTADHLVCRIAGRP